MNTEMRMVPPNMNSERSRATKELASSQTETLGRGNTIYLAGGFHSGWQKTVWRRLSNWNILDPSRHGIQNPGEYTAWDLQAIGNADVILAVLEAGNPGGYSLALEIGYAKALGKVVYLVYEPSDVRSKYFTMMREMADHWSESLEGALERLAASGKL